MCKRHSGMSKRLLPVPQIASVRPTLFFMTVHQHIAISHKLHLQQSGQYNLKGVIYYGDNHFISRFVDKSHQSWIIDGCANLDTTNLPGEEVRHIESKRAK